MKILHGLLALPLLTSSLLAEKEYILAKKVPPLPVNEKFLVVQNMKMPDGKIAISIAGQNIQGTTANSSTEEATYHFISEDKVRVTYHKNRELEKSSMMGENKNEEKIDPSEGKTVVLSKVDGEWSGKLEKGEIKEDEKEEFAETVKDLEKTFNNNTDAQMYGTKPRKVGDTWEVDPSLMPGMDEFNITDGKLKMTFLEVKEYEGEQCAVLKTTFNMTGSMDEDHMKEMVAKLEGSGQVIRSLKYLADLKFTGEMDMSIAGAFEAQPGMKAQMTMKGSSTIDIRSSKKTEKAAQE